MYISDELNNHAPGAASGAARDGLTARLAVHPEDRAVRVAIVGDASFGDHALAVLLADEGGFLVQEIDSASPDAPRWLRSSGAGALIADAHAADAAEAVEQFGRLVRAAPDTGVVAVVDGPDPVLARGLFGVGISGCLTRDEQTSVLFDAVYAAIGGESFVSPRIALALASFTEVNGPADLTTREKEVLRLIGLGLTNREIGQSMHLSVRTIETHRASLQRKLGTSRRADLVREASRLGLTR